MLSDIVNNLQRLNLRSLRFIVETIKSFTRGLVHLICPALQTLSIPKWSVIILLPKIQEL